MESLQSLKRRRKAVSSIGAITKAMEVVAAIKMRKSQALALDSRPYSFKVLDILRKLSSHSKIESDLTRIREVKKTLAILITSDRGLIGSFNSQLLRTVENFTSADSFIAVGKKANAYFIKKNLPVVSSFYGFGDFIHVEEIEPLYEYVLQGYVEGKWDKVITISMDFKSTLKQETLVRQILPIDIGNIGKSQAGEIDYIFEPSPKELIENLLPYLLKIDIYHLVLEANASEHAARYVAMKNASDNAEELSGDLIIQYNKVRQAAITSELVEMSATQSALK